MIMFIWSCIQVFYSSYKTSIKLEAHNKENIIQRLTIGRVIEDANYVFMFCVDYETNAL